MGDATWKTCGSSVRRSLKRFLDKTLENLSSMKMYVVLLASYLLAKGKLEPKYWFYAVAFCVATRHFVELASIVKDVKSMKYGATDAASVTNIVNNSQDAKDESPTP